MTNCLKKGFTAILTLAVLAAGVNLFAGCDQTYTIDRGLFPPPPQSTWKVYGDFPNPQYAIDGDMKTAAVGGKYLIIDFGRPTMFNLFVLLHGPNPDGYCAQVNVYGSVDGKNWGSPLGYAYGTKKVTSILLWGCASYRYVKFEAAKRGAEPWTIAEVYLQ